MTKKCWVDRGSYICSLFRKIYIPKEEPNDQTANICWITGKGKGFQINIYFCFTDEAKAFGCVDLNKLWNILKETGIPYHLTCLLRNLYAGQEATVRTGHRTTDRFQIRKGVHQGCILSPCLNYMQSNHEKCWTG